MCLLDLILKKCNGKARTWQKNVKVREQTSLHLANQGLNKLDLAFPVFAITRAFPRLPPVTRLFPRLPPVTRLFPRLPPVTRLFPRFPPVTRLFPRLPPVTRLFPRLPSTTKLSCAHLRSPNFSRAFRWLLRKTNQLERRCNFFRQSGDNVLESIFCAHTFSRVFFLLSSSDR